MNVSTGFSRAPSVAETWKTRDAATSHLPHNVSRLATAILDSVVVLSL